MPRYFTTTVNAEFFDGNVLGTVLSPENALGEPSSSYTQNASGSWTARWKLQTINDPALYTQKFDLSIRVRASDSFLPAPHIKSVKLISVKGEESQEYVFKAFKKPDFRSVNAGAVFEESQFWHVSNMMGTSTGLYKATPATVLGEEFVRGGKKSYWERWPRYQLPAPQDQLKHTSVHAFKPIMVTGGWPSLWTQAVHILEYTRPHSTEDALPLDYDLAFREIGEVDTGGWSSVFATAISPDGNTVAFMTGYASTLVDVFILGIGSDYQSIQSQHIVQDVDIGSVSSARFFAITQGGYIVLNNAAGNRHWIDYNQNPPVVLESPPVTFPDDTGNAPIHPSWTGEYVWMANRLYKWNNGDPVRITLPVSVDLSGSSVWSAWFSKDESSLVLMSSAVGVENAYSLTIQGTTATIRSAFNRPCDTASKLAFVYEETGPLRFFFYTPGSVGSADAREDQWNAMDMGEILDTGGVAVLPYRMPNYSISRISTNTSPFMLPYNNTLITRTHGTVSWREQNQWPVPPVLFSRPPLAKTPEEATGIDLTIRGQFDHYHYEGEFLNPATYIDPYIEEGEGQFNIFHQGGTSGEQVSAWSPDSRYVVIRNHYRSDWPGYGTIESRGSCFIVYDMQSGTPVLHPVSYVSLADLQTEHTTVPQLTNSSGAATSSRLLRVHQDEDTYYILYEWVGFPVDGGHSEMRYHYSVFELKEVGGNPTYTIHHLPVINQYLTDNQVLPGSAAEGGSYMTSAVWSPSRPEEICGLRVRSPCTQSNGLDVYPFDWMTDTVLPIRNIAPVPYSGVSSACSNHIYLDTALNHPWVLFRTRMHSTTQSTSAFGDIIGILDYATGTLVSYTPYFVDADNTAFHLDPSHGGGYYKEVSGGNFSPDSSMIALIEQSSYAFNHQNFNTGITVLRVRASGQIEIEDNRTRYMSHISSARAPAWFPNGKALIDHLGSQGPSQGYYLLEYDRYRQMFYRDTERYLWFKSPSPEDESNGAWSISPNNQWVIAAFRNNIHGKIKFFKMEYRPPLDLASELYVEIETEDIDGAAVQVSSIAMTFYDDFKVFAPRNLQTVTLTSNAAVVSWEWDPLYED